VGGYTGGAAVAPKEKKPAQLSHAGNASIEKLNI
jgi:hypothetical protein